MSNNSILIILSYPDTIVRQLNSSFATNLLSFLNFGNKNYIQAGHIAMLLIHKKTKKIEYFDFGRYITSKGFGRVRSNKTDPKLNFNIDAIFNNGRLENLNEILIYIYNLPHITHGEGRLFASINWDINYKKAIKNINELVLKKEIPYKLNVMNCSIFVKTIILKSCENYYSKINYFLFKNLIASPLGIVKYANSDDKVYLVANNLVTETSVNIFKTYLKTYWYQKYQELNLIGTELPEKNKFYLAKGFWLSGIGEGIWYEFKNINNSLLYKVILFDKIGNEIYTNNYQSNIFFNVDEEFAVLYPYNLEKINIQQGKEIIQLLKAN